MDRGVIELLPAMFAPPAQSVHQSAAAGEEGAFQLLLESLLLETLAGQVFQGGKGLLAGIDLGPDTGETSGQEEQKGQELLALLELLQVPLMEHFRGVLPAEGGFGQGDFAGNQPFVRELPAPMPDLTGNAGTQGGAAALPEEPSLPETLPGTAPQLSDRIVDNGVVAGQFQGSPPVEVGHQQGTAREGLPFMQALSRDAVSQGQLGDSPAGRETGVTGEAVPQAGKAGPDQPWLQFTADQMMEDQEPVPSSNRVESSVPHRSGITLFDLMDQMVQSGKLKLLAAKQEMELQLKPEYLGKLAIRLTLENGAMTAKFVVESHQVGRMLEQNLPQLRQTLAEQGIRFDQAQVEVGDPGSFAQERQPQWQQGRAFRESFVIRGVDSGEHQVREEDYPEPVRRAGIDYRA
ncbi:MAG TPA: flagellar hook-length control protein FliK [Clostridia bacterium]|nr:flagellar hook-length control protein FliK [Clostridia bacterium]